MNWIATTRSRKIRNLAVLGALLAALVIGGRAYAQTDASGPVSETSSISTAPGPTSQTSSAIVAPEPTPTYVSELAPAVMVAPREPNTLPTSGISNQGSTPWPKISGLALALLGALSIYAALRLKPEEAD